MFKKVLLCGAGLAVALGGPAVFFAAPDYWKSVRDKWLPAGDTTAINDSAWAVSPGASAQGVPTTGPPGPLLEGAPVPDLAEVLSFDVTTDWILRRWPRVSTGLARLQLQGYRVPLVSGTAESDIAGSLSYYFNPQQQVQQITFRGTTGDARKLVKLLTTRHKFAHRPTNDPGLFIYQAASPDGKVNSVLKIRSAGVVKSSRPHQRFQIDLVMERPKT